ncbi:MAG: hypothetical protein Q8Q10_03545 [bacterium]|nr:hypothetical protein [bacterium]
MHRTQQTFVPEFHPGSNGVNTVSWEVGTNEIQIAGHRVFPEQEWRKAIEHYLFGVWSASDEVVIRPKISFSRLTLRLNRSNGEYYAYGVPQEKLPPGFAESQRHYTLFVGTGHQSNIETGLIRFVKNKRIKLLRMYLPMSEGYLTLWKKSRRGQYGVTAIDLPPSWGVNGPEY